jgi:hypothetical protein
VEDDRAPRRQLHGYVSDPARDGWYDFSAAHGTNVTALMEATGILLANYSKKRTEALPAWLRQLLKESKSVASARSSRRRG